MRYLLTLPLLLVLPGCAAAILSGLTLADQLIKTGDDTLALTAVACQDLTAAHQRAPGNAALPWYDALCNNLRADNPSLDRSSPIWVAAGLAKVGQ